MPRTGGAPRRAREREAKLVLQLPRTALHDERIARPGPDAWHEPLLWGRGHWRHRAEEPGGDAPLAQHRDCALRHARRRVARPRSGRGASSARWKFARGTRPRSGDRRIAFSISPCALQETVVREMDGRDDAVPVRRVAPHRPGRPPRHHHVIREPHSPRHLSCGVPVGEDDDHRVAVSRTRARTRGIVRSSISPGRAAGAGTHRSRSSRGQESAAKRA